MQTKQCETKDKQKEKKGEDPVKRVISRAVLCRNIKTRCGETQKDEDVVNGIIVGGERVLFNVVNHNRKYKKENKENKQWFCEK
jgi:hypothetical protein